MATEKKIPAKTMSKKPAAAKSTSATGKVTSKKPAVKPAAAKPAAEPAAKPAAAKPAVKPAAKPAAAKPAAKPAAKSAAKKIPAKKPTVKKPAPKAGAPKAPAKNPTAHKLTVKAGTKAVPGRETKPEAVRETTPVTAAPVQVPAVAAVVGKPKYPVVRPGAKREASVSVKNQEVERYSDEELAEFEKLLEEKRDQILRQVKEIREDALKHNDEENVEEDGTNSFIRTANLQLAEKQQATFNAVQDALRAIKDKTYGICQTCGCKIPRERLQARPYAIRCVNCKTKYERDLELSRRQSQNTTAKN